MIKLLKNANQFKPDKETIENFNDLLKKEGLTADQAFKIIYILQEHIPVLPDNFELCSKCKSIFNSNEEGICEEDFFHCDECRGD